MKKLAICNQKGGVGKTTTAITLGAALAMKGYRVLLVDCDDSNPTLTKALVTKTPEELPSSLVNLMLFTSMNTPIVGEIEKAIVPHEEGYDVLPATSQLAGITVYLNSLQDETLKNGCLVKILSQLESRYDYILIDAAPALNTLSMNVMAAADEIIICTQAQDAAEEGIAELIQTMSRVRTNLNPKLRIAGLLITMEDRRTNYSKDTAQRITDNYSALGMKVFHTRIPRGVKGEEYIKSGCSLLHYAKNSKPATAYLAFAEEFIAQDNFPTECREVVTEEA